MSRTKALPNRAELIVEAAIELFSRYGYERTSIEDIAKHLDIGKGSIYLEFRTKEDILLKILEQHAETIYATMQAKVDNCKGSALETLKDMIQQCSNMVYDYVTRDIHTPEALLHTSLQFKHRFAHYHVRKRQLYLSLLKKAADAGEIPKSKANEEVVIALLMATSSLFPPYFNNYSESEARIEKKELQKRAQMILDIVIAGLKGTR